MQPGERVRLKGGIEATITGIGISDFIGDPYPVYLCDDRGGKHMLMSNEFKKRDNQPKGCDND